MPGMTLEDFLDARGVSSLAEIDATRERIPSSVVALTAAECQCLKDPDWIDEDEADVIVSMRREQEEGHLARPIREILRERGIKVDG